MTRHRISCSVALLSVVVCTTALATVDVALYWSQVTLELTVGSGKTAQVLQVHATTSPHKDAVYLSSLTLFVGKQRILCPSSLIGDLPFPQLGSLQVVYSGEQSAFDPRGNFALHLNYGQTPVADGRYVSARLVFTSGRPTSRTFAVPVEHGTKYQDERP